MGDTSPIQNPQFNIRNGNGVSRLAPSPTGALHLGNARTFLANWLLARQNGWTVLLRIEDLDGPRVKPNAAEQVLQDLRWLGMDFDQSPVVQSTRTAIHRAACDRLLADGRAYFCTCTRSEVQSAASAPHADDGSSVYPGTCRGRYSTAEAATLAGGRAPAVRFAVPPGMVSWNDGFAGLRAVDVAQSLGDFVIAKADRTAAYQLAVVVDDIAASVTHVVRGDDLLDSTPRQMLLYQALGHARQIPIYYHLPLVVGPDGRRLAKRHGDTRLSHFRQAGTSASGVLSLLAGWLGIETDTLPNTAADLIGRLDLSAIPRQPIVCDLETAATLTHG
jgi:glutamyl-tRNA synthetase